MIFPRKTLALSFACASFALSTSHATIINGAVTGGDSPLGSFVNLSVPFSESNPDNTVGNDTFQNRNLYGFDELQNVNSGAGGIAVDLLPGGGSGSIAPNTIVASHYVFFDPAGLIDQIGWVDFDSEILGVVTSRDNLLASDVFVNPGVNYLNPNLRGLETGDSVSIGDGAVLGGRLNVDWTAGTPGDYVRVFTATSPAAVPDGGSMAALLGIALMGLAGFRKRSAK